MLLYEINKGKNIAIISMIYYSGQVSEKFRRPLSFSNISTWYLIQGYIELRQLCHC